MMLENDRPVFAFTADSGLDDLSRMTCFVSGQTHPAAIQRRGDARYEVVAEDALGPGRTRFNCTVRTKEGRWRWFGTQYYLPE